MHMYDLFSYQWWLLCNDIWIHNSEKFLRVLDSASWSLVCSRFWSGGSRWPAPQSPKLQKYPKIKKKPFFFLLTEVCAVAIKSQMMLLWVTLWSSSIKREVMKGPDPALASHPVTDFCQSAFRDIFLIFMFWVYVLREQIRSMRLPEMSHGTGFLCQGI